MNNITPMLDRYFRRFVTNDHLEKLMDAANFVSSDASNTSNLNQALAWCKRALQLQENSSTLELTSKILYKLNRKAEAVGLMQSAIDKADNPSDKNKLTLVLNNMRENKRV